MSLIIAGLVESLLLTVNVALREVVPDTMIQRLNLTPMVEAVQNH